MGAWMLKHVGRESFRVEFGALPTKSRPRFNRSTGRTYTPDRTAKAEQEIRKAYKRESFEDWSKHVGPVHALIRVQRPLAKSNAKKRIGEPDLMAPDCDNLAKLVLDALNGVAYSDDRYIDALTVERLPRPEYGAACVVWVTLDYFEAIYKKG